MKKNICLIVGLILCLVNIGQTQAVNYLSIPGYNETTKIDPNGYSILPSGRYVTPAGKSIRISHDPFNNGLSFLL